MTPKITKSTTYPRFQWQTDQKIDTDITNLWDSKDNTTERSKKKLNNSYNNWYNQNTHLSTETTNLIIQVLKDYISTRVMEPHYPCKAPHVNVTERVIQWNMCSEFISIWCITKRQKNPYLFCNGPSDELTFCGPFWCGNSFWLGLLFWLGRVSLLLKVQNYAKSILKNYRNHILWWFMA